MGLSISGIKSVMEMQFADFATSGFNPIVNYLAKSHYRWQQPADVVVRMPCGGGIAAEFCDFSADFATNVEHHKLENGVVCVDPRSTRYTDWGVVN